MYRTLLVEQQTKESNQMGLSPLFGWVMFDLEQINDARAFIATIVLK